MTESKRKVWFLVTGLVGVAIPFLLLKLVNILPLPFCFWALLLGIVATIASIRLALPRLRRDEELGQETSYAQLMVIFGGMAIGGDIGALLFLIAVAMIREVPF